MNSPTTAFVSAIPLIRVLCNNGSGRLKPLSEQMSATPRAQVSSSQPSDTLVLSNERAASLPWKQTVANDECPLLFMQFLTHQLEVQEKRLQDVEELPFEKELSYQWSDKPLAKIESWQWKSSKFRKIRATYIDAGWKAQVFNSVWYPSPEYDLPILGIDFLSFGKKKVLCVMDFQPLTQEESYLKKYCERMEHVRSKYDGLNGRMSSRFYDEASFFSKQLIFAKFDNQDPVAAELYPGFCDYVNEYLNMMDTAVPDFSKQRVAQVREWQREYDQYSAERDPAVGLFSAYWGEKWAEKFTHEFLFSDAVPVVKEKNAPGAP